MIEDKHEDILERVQNQVKNGNYLVKPHAVLHALKEGFDEFDMVEAILQGRIIEEYPDDKRLLICGKTSLAATVTIYLHVVCEYRNPNYIDFVTAYIPDETQWHPPNFIRRNEKGDKIWKN
ncbi:MAG: DUF4258 domain-containing protein [Anaerolineae bacterium]